MSITLIHSSNDKKKEEEEQRILLKILFTDNDQMEAECDFYGISLDFNNWMIFGNEKDTLPAGMVNTDQVKYIECSFISEEENLEDG